MSTQKDGGPAYPTENENTYFHGMTMRQAYKMSAMQGMMAAGWIIPVTIAKDAGEYADAMIAEDIEHAAK